MKSLHNKVALITGAGNQSGIGFAAAVALGQAGAKVVVSDIKSNQVSLEQRTKELIEAGVEALPLCIDVTKQKDVDAAISSVVSHFGSIDIVFNNAGYPGGVGPFLDIDNKEFDISWQVNVMGCVNVCKAVIPHMQANGGGSIINNSSLSGLGAVPDMTGYCATKFAVVGLTKTLATEFGKDNIRVNTVCPGMVWTDMGAKEVSLFQTDGQTMEEAKKALSDVVPLQQRWADPSEIGDAVVYLASDSSSYVSGITLPVAGGLAPGL